MTTMQAKLEQNEYAFLLNILEAKKVVGINNRDMLPAEAAQREIVMSAGLAQLKAHGWFREHEGRFTGNNTLFLMTAVAASPETVISASYFDSAGVRQTVAYFIAEGFAVEQYQDLDGHYVLTLLDSPEQIAAHLIIAYRLPNRPTSVVFTAGTEEFAIGLAAARQGDGQPLIDLLTAQNVAPSPAAVSRAITSLRPAGQIQSATIALGHMTAWREIGLLRDDGGQLWLAVEDPEADTMTLGQATHDQLRSYLGRVLINHH